MDKSLWFHIWKEENNCLTSEKANAIHLNCQHTQGNILKWSHQLGPAQAFLQCRAAFWSFGFLSSHLARCTSQGPTDSPIQAQATLTAVTLRLDIWNTPEAGNEWKQGSGKGNLFYKPFKLLELKPLAKRIAFMTPEKEGHTPQPKVSFPIAHPIECVYLRVSVEVAYTLNINTYLVAPSDLVGKVRKSLKESMITEAFNQTHLKSSYWISNLRGVSHNVPGISFHKSTVRIVLGGQEWNMKMDEPETGYFYCKVLPTLT